MTDMTDIGNIKISDEVVKVIAARATLEVEGIYKMTSGVTDEVNKILGFSKHSRGIRVDVGEKECSIDAFIVVEYGYSIPEVAQKVQESIVARVTELTGLIVVEVNVYVQDVKVREPKSEADEELAEVIEEIEI